MGEVAAPHPGTIVLCKSHVKAWRWNFFFSPPATNLSNLLIEASTYCYLYALNEELKDYSKLLSDFRKI
jgi:hypothetical protein